jgi:uncharacterized protein YbaP (TraB family)
VHTIVIILSYFDYSTNLQGRVMKKYLPPLAIFSSHFRVVLFFTLFISCLSTVAFAQTSVWKVSKNGKTLYLGGTVHVLPTDQYPLPKPFDRAFNDSDNLMFETPLPDPTDMVAASNMMSKMSYTNGDTLSKKLNRSTYEKLNKYLSSFGINAAQFDQFKPGFLIVMMSMLELKKANLSGEGVDAYFMKKGREENKYISFFETADFQLSLLANMSNGNEDNFIKTSIKGNKNFAQKFERIVKYWRNGNEAGLQQVILEDSKNFDRKTYNALFKDRNHRWLPKIIQALSRTETTFILVGAGHLVGHDGVLALLKNKGYKIQQL